MSKTHLKILIWLFLVILVGTAGLFLLNRTAGLLASFQEGADPASALNIVPNRPPDLHVRLDWLPDAPDTGREIDPFTREQVESAYLRAWLQWNISYLRGEPYGLRTYFVGPALEAVTESINFSHQQGWSLAQTDLEHTLKLHFYSADGSIASFTAHNVMVAQILRDGATGAPLTAEVTRADYDVVMMLEDGNWRVRHWVRREPTDPEPVQPAAGEFVTTNGRDLMLDGQPFTMRGINYYPQDTPWHDFWPEYDESVIEADFQLIETLGLNTIRIFIPYDPDPIEIENENENEPREEEPTATIPTADGEGTEDAEDSHSPEPEPEFLDPYEHIREKLPHLLDTAADHNLKVIITLFDFRTDYQILLWPKADRDLEQFVPYFADHPAILAWDLKNEPDSDQPGNTPEMVNAWLTHTAAQVRRYDPNHLITIGWLYAQNAHQLADVVDFVSFHYYAPTAELSAQYAALRTAVPDKPIAITEFGLPTWNPFFFPGGHSEREQAVYYADVRRALEETDAAGYAAWTLYDFSHIPAEVVGRLPWRVAPQRHLGVINHAGEPKTAAFLLAADSQLDLPPLTPIDRFTKPFWLTIITSSLLFIAALGFLFKRLRTRKPRWRR